MNSGSIIRRILGGIMSATALAIIVISILGAFQVGGAVASLSTRIENTLQFTSDSLSTAGETIILTQTTIEEVGTGLDTAATATINLSGAIADSRPFLEGVNVLVTHDLPANLEAVQTALPNIVQVAGVIDQTLTTLNGIGLDRTIDLPFGQSIPLQWDLGINYNPEVPFDQTLSTFEDTLAGLPENLRGLENDLTTTTDNLGLLSDNMLTISNDLMTIKGSVGELIPLLDQYTALINDLQASLSRAQISIPAQLNTLRLGIILGLILLALSQLAGLYLGWELITGKRDQLPATVLVTAPIKEVPSEAS